MNIKAIKFELEGRDVLVERSEGGVDVTIYHPGQRNGAVLYPLSGEEADVKQAQRLVERITGVSWRKSHTVSMLGDLLMRMRQVAGV